MTQQQNISHSEIWQIAWPMILANISTPLLGMVDTAVVGHLDAAYYLGAVAIGAMIFSFLFWGFGFLRMVTTGLTAQAIGNRDNKQSHAILKQSLTLAISIALLMLLLQIPISKLSFAFIESSDLVLINASVYFDIRIWSAPAVLINFVLIGWLIGKQATKSALLIVLVININNIILDIIFVYFWDMNVSGVALASVIAEYLGLFIAIRVLHHHGIDLKSLIPKINSFASIINRKEHRLHLDVFIRTVCIIFSFAFFTVQGAKYGDTVLAANSVLLNFLIFMAFVLDAFANATEVLSGKAIGNNDKSLLKQALLLTGLWSLIVACLFSLCYFLFGKAIITLLTSIPEVITTANEYLIWLTIMPILGVWAYLFDGLFIGATRSVEMRNAMLFSTFICFLPAWYGLQSLGNHGLWLAFLIFLTARGLSQCFYLPRILQLR